MFELPDHSLEHGCHVIHGIAVPCIMLFWLNLLHGWICLRW